MAKWADRVISKVRYNAAETHIDQVRVADDSDNGFGAWRDETRQVVVAALNRGVTYVTAPPSTSSPGKLDRGAKVSVETIRGVDYIRTDADSTARDNLGNLPRY